MDSQNKTNDKQIYLLGAFSTIVVLIGIIIDIVVGTSTGGDLTLLPQTAVERFAQLHSNCLLGLYNLDLLNMINQIILIPAYIALFIAHKKEQYPIALLALIVFLVGTVVFIANNTSLTMLDLSNKYYSGITDQQKLLISAAGEAMLAKGSHGNLSVFLSFLLPNVAGTIISLVMIKGGIFSKLTGYFGMFGSIWLVAYTVLVTFIPTMDMVATAIAAPGGLMAMTWMIMFTVKLFKLSNIENKGG